MEKIEPELWTNLDKWQSNWDAGLQYHLELRVK